MSARNKTIDEIDQWVNLMKLQAGNTGEVRYRKHWQTKIPSIQGPWTPFTHTNPPNNLVTFPDKELGEVLHKEKSATEVLLEMVKNNQISVKKAE
jgi:large subunit ribosomal protein L43